MRKKRWKEEEEENRKEEREGKTNGDNWGMKMKIKRKDWI